MGIAFRDFDFDGLDEGLAGDFGVMPIVEFCMAGVVATERGTVEAVTLKEEPPEVVNENVDAPEENPRTSVMDSATL